MPSATFSEIDRICNRICEIIADYTGAVEWSTVIAEQKEFLVGELAPHVAKAVSAGWNPTDAEMQEIFGEPNPYATDEIPVIGEDNGEFNNVLDEIHEALSDMP